MDSELSELSESPASESAEGRRPDIEWELKNRYHVDFTFHADVKPSAFDAEKGLHNQARFNPIDQQTVDIYTEAVKRGDKFPAVIAWRAQPRTRFTMIDGNHRLAAHIAGDRPLDLYEIDRNTHPRTVALLTFAMNTRHGKPTTTDERIQQAIYLVDNGASAGAAAAAVNIGTAAVRKAITHGKADRRADAVGLRRNEWDALPVAVKNRLWNISTDEGFSSAARFAYAAKLNPNEVTDLVGLLNDSKSGVRQEAIVKAHLDSQQERIQEGAGGVLGTASKRHLNPKQRTTMALSQILALPESRSIITAFAEPERAAAAQRCREAGNRCYELADLLTMK